MVQTILVHCIHSRQRGICNVSSAGIHDGVALPVYVGDCIRAGFEFNYGVAGRTDLWNRDYLNTKVTGTLDPGTIEITW